MPKSLNKKTTVDCKKIESRSRLSNVSHADNKQGIRQLIMELRSLAGSFRDARAHTKKAAFDLWLGLRKEGNSILRDCYDHGLLRFIEEVRDFENADQCVPSMPKNLPLFLFDRLVGFTLANLAEDSDYPGEMYFNSGFINQRPIHINVDLDDEWITEEWVDFDKIWDRHGFELIGRCISGCELLVEIIEKELDPPIDRSKYPGFTALYRQMKDANCKATYQQAATAYHRTLDTKDRPTVETLRRWIERPENH